MPLDSDAPLWPWYGQGLWSDLESTYLKLACELGLKILQPV